jgi:succinyl-CoA synthetase beta subunit
MRLHEYQSKALLAAHGIPVPEGEVAASGPEAAGIARRLGGRVAVKAQALMGGRGKAGGIALAEGPDEAEGHATRLLADGLAGNPVHRVLVERAADIVAELYLGLVLDRRARRMVLMASPDGGIDIEDVARQAPERVLRLPIDPAIGLRSYQLTRAARHLGLSGRGDRPVAPTEEGLAAVARGLYACAQESDATLAEINPLVVTVVGATGRSPLLALDAKMVIDDSALFRHPDLVAARDPHSESEAERRAREAGISYVKLEGRVGCMVNGAGLAMATMDVLKLHGGEPANFLDVGGGAREERVAQALRLILPDPDVAAILINIFGGITRCDEVARGIVSALRQAGEIGTAATVPVVIRLVGTNEREGRRILEEAGLTTAATLSEGARLAVAAAMTQPSAAGGAR